MKYWKSQQGKLLIAKRYKAAFLIAFVVILGYPAYALPIKDVQSTSSCDLFNCVTWVDLTTLGLNTQQVNAVKGMNLTKYLPKVEQYTGLKSIGYNITGNILYITGTIRENTYWTMDLGTYVTLDPWWNTSFPYRRNFTVYNAKADYPTFINVTYDSDMQSDFDDIRFVDSSNNVLVYYLRKKVDSSYAEYDVLNVSNGSSIYYGNAAATSNSNVTSVFGSSLYLLSLSDENTGTTTNNSLGGVNGTITGADWTTKGRQANALSYVRANSDRVTWGTAYAPTGGNLTIEAWVNLSTAPGAGDYYGVVMKENSFGIWLKTATAVSHFDIGSGSAWSSGALTSVGGCTALSWCLVTVTFNNVTKNRSVYFNGIFNASDTSSVYLGSGSGTLAFGENPTTNFMNGIIDEVKIYNKVMSQADISNHYASVEPTVSWAAGEETYRQTNTTLYLNGSRANMSATNNTYINITAFCNVSANITLYQNTTLLNSSYGTTSVNSTFFNGVWLMNATVSSNDTYNGSTESWYLTIVNITPIPIYNVSIDTHICFKTKPVCIDTLTNKVYINGVQQ